MSRSGQGRSDRTIDGRTVAEVKAERDRMKWRALISFGVAAVVYLLLRGSQPVLAPIAAVVVVVAMYALVTYLQRRAAGRRGGGDPAASRAPRRDV